MAISDNKKCQTLINAASEQITLIRESITILEGVKNDFLTQNPSTAGTVLQGNIAALNASLTNLRAEVDKAVWDTLLSGYVPSHEGNAL